MRRQRKQTKAQYNDFIDDGKGSRIIKAIIHNNPKPLFSLSDQAFVKAVHFIPEIEVEDKMTQQIREDFKNDNVTLLHIAAAYDSLECYIYCLERVHGRIDIFSSMGFTHFQYACLYGSMQVVTYACHVYGKSFVQAISNTKLQVIALATLSGNPDLLKMLFSYGADINSEETRRNNVVQSAVRHRRIESLRILLKEGSKHRKDWKGMTPLMVAICQSQPEAALILLDFQEDPSFYTDDGKCALELACFQQFTEVVRALCQKLLVIDPPVTGTLYHQSAIHWACRSYVPEIVRIILEKGCDLYRLDKDGYIGPHYFVDLGNSKDVIEILNILLSYGFDINTPSITKKGEITLLEDFLRSIRRDPVIIKWLIEHGADPLIKMSNGKRICEIELDPRRCKSIIALLEPFKAKIAS